MVKLKKTATVPTAPKPRADMNGWVLCPGDGVLIISPGEEYHGLFAKVDSFPSTQGDWSTYVQIDGRPSSSGCKLVPNAHLRWMGPGLDQLDLMRPTRPGQRVRVVLDNESLATAEMKALDGQLGEVTELGPISGNNVSMITVKFDDTALLPAAVYNYDLLIVPTPVVQYVPEPDAEAFDPYKLPHYTEVRAEQDQERGTRRQEPVAPFAVAGQAAHEAAQVVAPEPHRVGWAHKDGSQMNHHYDAQGATACGYKRKAGSLHFAGEPDKLPRWQRCEKCDEQLVSAMPVPAAKSELTLSMEAWDLLEQIAQHLEYNTSQDEGHGPQLNELQAAGLIELMPYANGTTVRATAAGMAAAQEQPDVPKTPLAEALDTAAAGLRVVPLASIVVTTNTRKVFDEAELAELAESMKAHGILQPLVVRPHTEAGQYELVAGGRRYRAAQLAGITEVPATVRTLTDREFLEVQLLENLQRVDVRPADEATAFAKLLGSNFSAEEIGLKVGKSAKFVKQRAQLMHLIPFFMDALIEDRLALVSAQELARLPAHSQLVAKHHLAGSYNDNYPPKAVKNCIEEKVTRELAKAGWSLDDATLVPSAGPCTSCPKRSTAQGLLFEASGPALCLDGGCFANKRAAVVNNRFDELTKELGKAPLQVTSNYSLADNQKSSGIIPSRDYYTSREGVSGAVAALMVDGSDAGQIVYVRLSGMAAMKEGRAHATDAQKAEDAARIRKDRTKKMHRTLLAERLTAELPASIADEGNAAHGALDYFILEELKGQATAKIDYLKQALGWEPTAEAEKDDYNTYDALGFRPWKSWLLSQLDALGFVEKLNLFFILKVRHRMDHEYEDLQFDIAKLIGETYDSVKAEAEQAVEERYYSKGKKQEATA